MTDEITSDVLYEAITRCTVCLNSSKEYSWVDKPVTYHVCKQCKFDEFVHTHYQCELPKHHYGRCRGVYMPPGPYIVINDLLCGEWIRRK